MRVCNPRAQQRRNGSLFVGSSAVPAAASSSHVPPQTREHLLLVLNQGPHPSVTIISNNKEQLAFLFPLAGAAAARPRHAQQPPPRLQHTAEGGCFGPAAASRTTPEPGSLFAAEQAPPAQQLTSSNTQTVPPSQLLQPTSSPLLQQRASSWSPRVLVPQLFSESKSRKRTRDSGVQAGNLRSESFTASAHRASAPSRRVIKCATVITVS